MTHIPAPLSFHAYDKNAAALLFRRSYRSSYTRLRLPAVVPPLHLLFSVHHSLSSSKWSPFQLPPSDFSILPPQFSSRKHFERHVLISSVYSFSSCQHKSWHRGPADKSRATLAAVRLTRLNEMRKWRNRLIWDKYMYNGHCMTVIPWRRLMSNSSAVSMA
jgi:hypothetical protein